MGACVRTCALQAGGLGFIHYNCTIAEQAAMVAKVKAHEPGFVVNTVCMRPSDPVSAIDALKVCRLVWWGWDGGGGGAEPGCTLPAWPRSSLYTHLRPPETTANSYCRPFLTKKKLYE